VVTKPYYQDALVTLYHGDCRDILPTLTFDVVISDPPFGIMHDSAHGASWQGTQIAGDMDTTSRDWMLTSIADTPAIVFGTWKVSRPSRTRQVLIWDKGPASGMGDLMFPWKNSFEEIYIIGDGFTGRRDEAVLFGHRIVTWESNGREHPNQKPESLMLYLIGKCPDGVILDPFCGSGTTLAAAKRLARASIGIEIDERYCEIAARRLSQGTLAEMFR
jgi:site-specific DNA-methyltransferase (adenine-specific)